MTLGSRRSPTSRAILRELPAPTLGPMSPLTFRATAKIRAKVKARTGLAAQVEDPTTSSRRNIQAQVEPEEQGARLEDEGRGENFDHDLNHETEPHTRRNRTNTTSSVLTTGTSSSSSSIPTITVTNHRETQHAIFAEAEGQGLGSVTTSNTGSSVSLPGAVSTLLEGSLPTAAPTAPTPTPSAGLGSGSPGSISAPPAGRTTPGVDSGRDPRLITVSHKATLISHSHCFISAHLWHLSGWMRTTTQ